MQDCSQRENNNEPVAVSSEEKAPRKLTFVKQVESKLLPNFNVLLQTEYKTID